MVDKDALRQVFSEHFRFTCQFSFHTLSCWAGTISQIVAGIPSGLSLTHPQETKKKKVENEIGLLN
jgi:hypothetical protein